MPRAGEVQTGPSYGGGITHAAGRLAIDASYERSFLPAFGFGGLTASEMFHAGLTVPFAHGRMFAAGGFTWRRTEPSPIQGLTIRLDSYWTQSTFGYYIARWLRMEAFYALTHQASSAQGNVDRTRIGIQFVTSKPMRIQ
jgi:hypothetical protein